MIGFGGTVLSGDIFSGDLSKTYDNAIVEAFENMDESLKENMPVYQTKAYMEGNWLQKAFTTSFWATDGFDGLAFLASAYVPGGIIGKVGSLSKALQASKMLKARKFGNKLKEFGQKAGVNTQLATSTLYNTISEAGFEAAEVNAVMREEFARQLGFNSYEEAQRNPEADAIIRDKAGAAAARTFAWNSFALTVPNFLQSK